MKITTIGIDLAKNVFQAHGVNEHGKTEKKKAAQAQPGCGVLCESAAVLDWHGGVWQRALLGP